MSGGRDPAAAARGQDDLARGGSAVHRLEARAKLLPALAAIALSALVDAASAWKLAALAALLLLVARAAHVPLRALLVKVLALLPFAALIALTAPLLPGDAMDGARRTGLILARAATSLLAAAALMATTPWHELLEGASKVGVPRAFALVLHFVHRYIFVLADEVASLRRARDARLCGRLSPRMALVSGSAMIGALFLRSLERAERVEAAMAARGFAGEWRTLGRRPFGARDGAALALGLATVAALWVA